MATHYPDAGEHAIRTCTRPQLAALGRTCCEPLAQLVMAPTHEPQRQADSLAAEAGQRVRIRSRRFVRSRMSSWPVTPTTSA